MDYQAESPKQLNRAYVLVDDQLIIMAHNQALYQWSREENLPLIGRPIADIFPELLDLQAALAHTGIPPAPISLSRIYRPPLEKINAPPLSAQYLDIQIEPVAPSLSTLVVIISDVTHEVWLETQLKQERQERQMVLAKHQELETILQSVQAEAEKQAAERLEELMRANRLILALSQVAARLEKAPNPDQVVETLGSELKQLGVTSFLTLYDKTQEVLVVEYTSIEAQILPLIEKLTGLHVQGLRFSRNHYPAYAELVDNKKTLFLPDISIVATSALLNLTKLQIEQMLELAGISPGTPGLSLPLLVEEQVLGVLLAFGPELRQEDIPIFSVFAGQVAIAFENARLIAALHEDITKRIEAETALLRYATRLEILHQIDLDILTAQSSAEIAYGALVRIRPLLLWQYGSVILFNFEADEALALVVSLANGSRSRINQRLPLKAFNVAVLQQGGYELIEDLPAQSSFTSLVEPLSLAGLQTYLSLPLIYQETLIGGLNLGLSRGAAFTGEHIEIAGEIANQLAIAIKNQQLAEQIQQYAEELEQRVAARTTELYTANQVLQREIAERKQVEALLYHNAFYDSLTSLANRARLIEYLERALEQAKEESDYTFALLFIDLDRFKIVNDSLGHLAGDHLLTTIAHRLQANVRAQDLVARLGGDEFAIVLDDLKSSSQAQLLAERIQQEIAQPIEIEEQEVFTTASIGITMYDPVYQFPQDLLRDADAAMYRAKMLGRARYQLFEPEMYTQAVNQLTLEAELRRALERQEFVLYYQPIVAVTTGQITGVEALLRWQHPQRGLILPLEFLSIAEETGLIIPLGEWILRSACHQVRVWQQAGHPSLRIAVNISVYQLQHSNLPALFQEILAQTGLSPHHLELEITESAALRNVSLIPQTLHKLSSLGLQIVIDDFGRGYSWLSHLKYLPSSKLKIGQDFIRSVTTHSKEREIVSAMLTVAEHMGTVVVAEGVETPAQLEFLKKHGCHEAQGYFFYPPLPVEELTRLLQAGIERGLS